MFDEERCFVIKFEASSWNKAENPERNMKLHKDFPIEEKHEAIAFLQVVRNNLAVANGEKSPYEYVQGLHECASRQLGVILGDHHAVLAGTDAGLYIKVVIEERIM